MKDERPQPDAAASPPRAFGRISPEMLQPRQSRPTPHRSEAVGKHALRARAGALHPASGLRARPRQKRVSRRREAGGARIEFARRARRAEQGRRRNRCRTPRRKERKSSATGGRGRPRTSGERNWLYLTAEGYVGGWRGMVVLGAPSLAASVRTATEVSRAAASSAPERACALSSERSLLAVERRAFRTGSPRSARSWQSPRASAWGA